MGIYIHTHDDWPNFHWDAASLASRLAQVRYRQGLFRGRLAALGFAAGQEQGAMSVAQDVLASSAIEGELLDAAQVRSSVARRLGLPAATTLPLAKVSRHVDGAVSVLLDATQNHAMPLSEERLCEWHDALFPPDANSVREITVGAWRRETGEPMRVVSGAFGHEHVHFEALAAERVPSEMARFLAWANAANADDLVLKAAVAHLWFLTIHPFDDGNGRIARAIAELFLARSDTSTLQFNGLSSQILKERNDYYSALERAQKGTLEITSWLTWFLGCFERSIQAAEASTADALRKGEFWRIHADAPLNGRQRLLLNKLLDGFTGKLRSSKWALLAKCSPDTALRDIQDLETRGILEQEEAGGRSTSYRLRPF
ncbi:MAG: Fic family protein [Puniceicoccales bacterium]|jgi:Fic family protein|nr:Fic family protein [Puniceicoccales bacterium]